MALQCPLPAVASAEPRILGCTGLGYTENNATCDAVACGLAAFQVLSPLRRALEGTTLSTKLESLLKRQELNDEAMHIFEIDTNGERLRDAHSFLDWLFQAASVSEEVSPEPPDCPICLEPLIGNAWTTDVGLHCGHRLHRGCFEQIRQCHNLQCCPMCRHPFPSMVLRIKVRLASKGPFRFGQYTLTPSSDATEGDIVEVGLRQPSNSLLPDMVEDTKQVSVNRAIAEEMRSRERSSLRGFRQVSDLHCVGFTSGCSYCGRDWLGKVECHGGLMVDVTTKFTGSRDESRFSKLEQGLCEPVSTTCGWCRNHSFQATPWVHGVQADNNSRWLYSSLNDCWVIGPQFPEAAIKKMLFLSLPAVLKITIGRTMYDQVNEGITQSFSVLDFPVVGLDLAPFLGCPPPQNACTLYDLRLGIETIPQCPVGRASMHAGVGPPGNGRYVCFAKGDKWYDIDVCNSTQPSTKLTAADSRMTSATVISLVYVRRDCLKSQTHIDGLLKVQHMLDLIKKRSLKHARLSWWYNMHISTQCAR